MKRFTTVFAIVMVAALAVSVISVFVLNGGFAALTQAVEKLFGENGEACIVVKDDDDAIVAELSKMNETFAALLEQYKDDNKKLADEVAKLVKEHEDALKQDETHHQELIKQLKEQGLCCNCCKCTGTETKAPSKQPAETKAPSKQPAETKAPSKQPAETKAPSKQPAETKAPSKQPAETEKVCGHSRVKYVAKSSTTHETICKDCGWVISVDNCSFNSKGVCTKNCGNVQEVETECTHATYKYVAKTETTHKVVCKSCGELIDVVACSFNSKGVCTKNCGNVQVSEEDCSYVYIKVTGLDVHHRYCEVHVNEQEVEDCTPGADGKCIYCNDRVNSVINSGDTPADPDTDNDTPAEPDNDTPAEPDVDTPAEPDEPVQHVHDMKYVSATPNTHHAYCDSCVNCQYEEQCTFVDGECIHCHNHQSEPTSFEDGYTDPF